MTVYLDRRGYGYSATTIHKYMNTELGLRSVVRPKKTDYEYGKPHKVFENKIKQDFKAADGGEDDFCVDHLLLHLRPKRQGIGHQVVHQAGAPLGMAVDGGKGSLLNDGGRASRTWNMCWCSSCPGSVEMPPMC